jgi:hypothetical protein
MRFISLMFPKSTICLSRTFKYHWQYLEVLLTTSNADNIAVFGLLAKLEVERILKNYKGIDQGQRLPKPDKSGYVSCPPLTSLTSLTPLTPLSLTLSPISFHNGHT